MGRTAIEWTERSLNPGIFGCTKISPACDHCYAVRMAHRLAGSGIYPEGITRHELDTGTDWTGRVVVSRDRAIHAFEQLARKPAKPTRVFVTSMADLFHRHVPDEHLALVFGAMASRPEYVFLVLTKRAARLAEWAQIRGAVFPWPSNVWAGVTVENQEQANRRVPALLQVPAPVRFVSCEPLLGPVDLTDVTTSGRHVQVFRDSVDALTGRRFRDVGDGAVEYPATPDTIGWVIAGGESGPGARPTHPDWSRWLRDQAVAAGVPFLWKQWGAWRPGSVDSWLEDREVKRYSLVDPQGAVTYTDTLPITTGPGVACLGLAGKRYAGRELDGRTWDEAPDLGVTP